MEYEKLTLSEQLMVKMIAKLLVLDPVFAEDIKDEVSEGVWHNAEAFYVTLREGMDK